MALPHGLPRTAGKAIAAWGVHGKGEDAPLRHHFISVMH